MQAVLVMFRSDGDRRSFSVTRDITVIGRREDCDLRIPLGDVSRKHCRLIRDADALRLEDLGSSNGTFHNGHRVQEASLSPGDSVQVGPVVFVLQVDGVPADDELQPVTAEPTAAAAGGRATPDEQGPLQPTAQSEVGSHGHAAGEDEHDALEPAAAGDALDSLDSLDALESAEPLSDEDAAEFDMLLDEPPGHGSGEHAHLDPGHGSAQH